MEMVAPYPGGVMVILKRLNLVFAATSWVANCIIILGLLAVVYFAFDRAPPYSVLSVEPASARPGEMVKLRMHVRSDVSRQCSADLSRFVFDALNARYFLDHAQLSAELIAKMEARTPGIREIAIMVPSSAAPGPARMVSSLEYECNRVHSLWPIRVTTEAPFTILPR